MTNRFARPLVALLLVVFLTTPAFPQTSPDSQDPKAVAKAAAEAKKQAERQAKKQAKSGSARRR